MVESQWPGTEGSILAAVTLRPLGDCYYIYVLRDPVTQRVRYVGFTENPHRRLSLHVRDASREQHTGRRLKAWIEALQEKSCAPEMCIIEMVSKGESRQAEKRWCDHYLAAGDDLCNSYRPQPNEKKRIEIAITDLMSVAAAATYKGVTPRAIYQRIDRGLLPVVKAGTHRLIYRHHLDAWTVDKTKQQQDRSKVAKKAKQEEEQPE